jgi:sterol desaturase/sphingolipid hydroxylase (fatty acid hydroxylase superfamily)
LRQLLLPIVLLCGALALVELWIPLFAANRRAHGRKRANLSLALVTFLLNWALDSTAAILALELSIQGRRMPWLSSLSGAALTAIGVLILDLTAYFAHLTLHKSPLLWRVHRVHHCDPFVDVTTAFRQHPIEGIWRFLWTVVPVWLFGLPAAGVILYRILSAGNALFEHANIRVSQRLDRAVARIWVSPNMHKVHHSQSPLQTDSNYGNILSIYDRAFRTFRATDEAFSVKYGLEDVSPDDGKSIARLVTLPFA